jgi:hypothetical protein
MRASLQCFTGLDGGRIWINFRDRDPSMGRDGEVTGVQWIGRFTMDDIDSKPPSKAPISRRKEDRPSGIVAELAGLLAGVKVETQGYEEYLTKKYS